MLYKSSWPFFNQTMINNVVKILQSGRVNQWTGTRVFEFEKKFSDYFGVAHSIAVFNGSVALELCLKAIDLQFNDEVIVTSRTFIASASSINICGGVPVFIDVDENSQNITLENIIKACTDKTKAVILVHLAGWPCDVQEIVDYCHTKGIYVIEDCAQSHGAKYNGKYVGTFGDINAWSFCQDKIITTGGEGGMVTTNNHDLFLKAWSYKDHGKNYKKINDGSINKPGRFRWLHDSIGTNFRMTEMQASIGIDALDELNKWVIQRRTNADILTKALCNIPAIRIAIPDIKYYHSYYKYYCFVDENYLDGYTRDDVIDRINGAGIPCFQGTCGEVYKEAAYNIDLNLPITRKLTKQSLMFLVDPSYSTENMQKISNIIAEIMRSMCKI